MRPVAKLAIALAAAVLTSPVWGFELAYLAMLPRNRPVLPATTEATAFELNALWLEAARQPSKEVTSLWALNFFHGFRAPKPSGSLAAARVARLWVEKERDAHRKIKRTSAELATTVWLSRHASADELERALAEWSYFGRGAYGIKAASNAWFGCGASPTIAQDALLIGLLQSPGRHPELMRERRLHLLESLAATGVISRDEEARATAENAEGTILPSAPDCPRGT
jgi:hypothetical protein